MVIDDTARERLAAFLRNAAAARSVRIDAIEILTGGTLQYNFLLDLCLEDGPESGKRRYVLRVTRPGSIEGSISRAQEFAIMQAAWRSGVTVPEPLWLAEDPGIIGADFLVMRFVPGIAAPQRILREARWGGSREALAERIGMEAARMQRVKPGFPGLDFLAVPSEGAARGLIDSLRLYLDREGTPRPAIEWGLRWLELNAPPARDLVLTHGDFRTGNYLVDEQGLTGILDWELAAWGDPLLDLAWFCMRFWRFGNPAAEAGGIAGRHHLWRGYEAVSGHRICPDEAVYWEIMANTRWAVLSVQQAARHLDGSLTSLELALTGRCTAEMEYETLRLIGSAEKTGQR
ncbi:MAG: phosphotransferase family protein [Hyphomicrobiaceae bacterium]|nr:phosphotransferase family protein [Hyphomicrobiaceae bacterium]